MLDERHLEFVITDDERRHFDELGYLVVEDAIPTELVQALEKRVDAIYDEEVSSGRLPANASLFYPNFLCRDPLFVDLLDWHTTFPKVWGILGWNIYSYHSHLGVNPPLPDDADRTKRTLGWHQDSGRVNVELECHPRPRLSLKIAFFLSDVSEPGRANLHIIPGSHLKDSLERPTDGVSDPDGAMPVCVPPGTAVFFDRRLWHAASPNWSNVTRKVLFVGYGYRWLRSKDNMTIPNEWLEAVDPVRRQLLGGGLNANGHFSPKDGDVPLKVWLQEKSLITS
jgi:ectoine hydroxylase-related dioxygenase (phytanoyl-CoA dioxygenase family)